MRKARMFFCFFLQRLKSETENILTVVSVVVVFEKAEPVVSFCKEIVFS